MTDMVSSAKGVLSLLRETDNSILLFALKRLLSLMNVFWYEISADLSLLEELHESESLTEETRKLAALVASQAYFHLGSYDESVRLALEAGNAFDSTSRSLFTDTILSRCIDQYVQYQETPEDVREPLNPQLEALFVSLTQSWIMQEETFQELKELVGFTIRARRLDFLERVLRQSLAKTQSADILNYTFRVADVVLTDIAFRRQVLRLLAGLYTDGLATVDFFALTQCLVFLEDPAGTTAVLLKLIQAGDKLTAYQVAFDLFESCSQEFLSSLIDELSKAIDASAEGTEAGSSDAAAVKEKLLTVLSGVVTTDLEMKFLYASCAADVHVLNHIKRRIDPSKSLMHNATVIANALMYSGTTIDAFLRDNQGWLRKTNYWARFTAIASIGAIHRGHVDAAMTVLDPYLPKGGTVKPLPFEEAGALYALGLIHSPLGLARDRTTIDYLLKNLRDFSANLQIIHGGCLGLGLAAMGLREEEIYDTLFTFLSSGEAVAGESAAVAIGMVMMGSGKEDVTQTLLNLAREENQKEKVMRGVAMAVALIQLGHEAEALPLSHTLLDSQDPWVRLGGCFVLGLAFAGTENTTAIEQLLQVTVKDTSDDVRRSAAMMIGFVTLKNPDLCFELLEPLMDSYNAHIRYGVVMALAISGAGTAHQRLVEALWTAKDDSVDLVRQGAWIALSLVLVQATEKEEPKVKELRQLLETMISDRRQDACTKFGCILACGILDAGGRNVTFALHRDRHRVDKAVVGMFMFMQYWYWFPYTLMLPLAMQPTCIIALNENLEMPEYTFVSNATPSYFAPPKSVLQEKKEVKQTGPSAVVLSTTVREEELRQRRRLNSGAGGSAGNSKVNASKGGKDKADAEGEAAAASAEKEPKEAPEPKSVKLQNPARVTSRQFGVLKHDVDERYVPLQKRPHGVCLLKDTKPDLGPQKLVAAVNVDDDEAPVPKPFTYP